MAIDGAVANYNENAGSVVNARELRRQFDRLMMSWDVRTHGGSASSGTGNGGVCRHYGAATTGDLAVIQRAAGANMSVDVLLGGAMVGGTESAHQGEYFVYNDASANVVITAADGSNPRKDLIGIQIRDTEYSGANNDARILVITGTAGAVPAEPSVPANFVTLALVDVPAAAASIVTGNITDRRRTIAALGGVTSCTSTTRPTVGLWDGMHIFERDTKALLFYDATAAAWKRTGGNVPHSDLTYVTPGGARTISSTSYVDWPTDTVQIASFVKHRADTLLIAETAVTNVWSDATANYATGVRINGVDTECSNVTLGNSVGNFHTGGMNKISGLAAGTYTCVFRHKVSASNQRADAQTRVILQITETLDKT